MNSQVMNVRPGFDRPGGALDRQRDRGQIRQPCRTALSRGSLAAGPGLDGPNRGLEAAGHHHDRDRDAAAERTGSSASYAGSFRVGGFAETTRFTFILLSAGFTETEGRFRSRGGPPWVSASGTARQNPSLRGLPVGCVVRSGTRVAARKAGFAPAGPQPLEDALARGELVPRPRRASRERKESPGGRAPGLLDAPCDPGRRILGDPLRLGADVRPRGRA